MITVESVEAWTVLDSRCNPTVRTKVVTSQGEGIFTVPAGASTGMFEAIEVRDGYGEFGGKGVRKAISNIRKVLGPVILGMDVTDQRGIDSTMEELDGTPNLSRLGANAVLSVSGAVATAAASSLKRPIYSYLGGGRPGRIPAPLLQILNAGLHAKGGIEVQDFSIVPMRASSLIEAIEISWQVFNAAKRLLIAEGSRPVVGEEGGLSPPFKCVDEAFQLLESAVEGAGYRVSRNEIALALDVASSHFFNPDGEYELKTEERRLSSGEMVDMVSDWARDHCLVSIEDPLAEEDWEGWSELTSRIGGSTQILGDDLLATNMERLERCLRVGAANAVLVKPNQAGTLTRAVDVFRKARQEGLGTVVSARSGETCDSFISDLAVGLDAGQIKVGSITGSERLAKYNRLLEIEREYTAEYAGARALSFKP